MVRPIEPGQPGAERRTEDTVIDASEDVVLGFISAPGAATDLATALAADLDHALRERSPEIGWEVQRRVDGLVQPPADDGEIVLAARERMLAEGWDLVVCLTDLPLRVGRRPVVAHASPVQGVAVLSVPALGAVATRRRARETVLRLVDSLLGDGDDEGASATDSASRRHRRRARRLRQLGSEQAGRDGTLRFTARVLTGNLSLLAGMLWANRPWQLAAGLSRALVAALTAGVFALVTSDIWRLADAYGPLRLTAIAVGSVLAITTTLILGAGLWERATHRRMRRQVVLFNIATTGTVLIGVLTLYAVLLLLATLAAWVLVVPELHADAVGHGVDLGDVVELAWLTTSLATAGGALGAGLETDEAVRRAAYTHRVDPRDDPGS